MGTVIRVIFREGVPRQRTQNRAVRRSPLARERGLTMWRERDDLVIAAAYRVAPLAQPLADQDAQPLTPLRFAPHP